MGKALHLKQKPKIYGFLVLKKFFFCLGHNIRANVASFCQIMTVATLVLN